MSVITVGSQYRFEATITKNGAVWDLTGATVLIYFKRPDGTTFSKSASLLNATAGQVNYDSAVGDLNQAGTTWTRSWQVTLGGVVDYTPPVQFTVLASP